MCFTLGAFCYRNVLLREWHTEIMVRISLSDRFCWVANHWAGCSQRI
jgi:hypothetical protein